ncbi:adenine phosphoribosyltransferase [Spirabiliibacterium falconis]|uniref:adenine phosphoribosyltransferase n=1 Tax=Spirabiliibacterium falconis TaxID=572023 RepID=UPI001AAD7CFA|nr:adenine phosphoribosyltransferase [Spirabiliibacterium falconis]MBE2893731.1 adenine phosphoribosyltransferase [Spirabiliibacterium falconis]
MTSNRELIRSAIKAIPDYPKEGIIFRDITSLLENPCAFQATIDTLVAHYKDKGITKVIGTESRGFIFGAPVALALGLPFVLVRKPGKLPRTTLSQRYQLEYGEDTLEIHTDAINAQDNVLIVDDLLATGGTVEATAKLVRRLGGKAHHAGFIIRLIDLGGKERLAQEDIECFDIVEFSEEQY